MHMFSLCLCVLAVLLGDSICLEFIPIKYGELSTQAGEILLINGWFTKSSQWVVVCHTHWSELEYLVD